MNGLSPFAQYLMNKTVSEPPTTTSRLSRRFLALFALFLLGLTVAASLWWMPMSVDEPMPAGGAEVNRDRVIPPADSGDELAAADESPPVMTGSAATVKEVERTDKHQAPEEIAPAKTRESDGESAATETPTEAGEAEENAPVVESRTHEGYVKIDSNGKRLGEEAEQWACVEDRATGLVWEVKSVESGLHSAENLYSWYRPDAGEEYRGSEDAGRCDGLSDCDTRGYVQALNRENYCGLSDWRLPTLEEMMTVVKINGSVSGITMDTEYFPQALPSWYWTASSKEEYPCHAWYILFRNGIALLGRKSRPKHLRLVRSEHSDE